MTSKSIKRQKVSLNSPIIKKLGFADTINEITVRRIVGSDTKKTVRAFTNERGIITLFEGGSYNPNWTESDAINRLKELISA